MSIFELPNEKIYELFNWCDLTTICNLRIVCHRFKLVSEAVLVERYKFITTLINKYDAQVKELSKGAACLISDQPHDNIDIKKIKPKEIADFLALLATAPLKACTLSYRAFKESLIGALCTIDCVDKIIDSDSLGVLERAKNRVKGVIYLIREPAVVCGERNVDDKLGRGHGNYGTEGGLLASVRIGISSTISRNRGFLKLEGNISGDNDIIIDNWLPGKLFLGIREGDSIVFPLGNREIQLVCRERSTQRYPYIIFQYMFICNCEEYLITSPDNFTPPLPQAIQNTKIAELLKQYEVSIGMKKKD